MKKLILWAWNKVPAQYQTYVVIIISAIILGLLGFSVYKIQKWGYDRCESKYENAAVKLKDDSRKEILKAEKQYDNIKTKIIKVEGNNGIAGPRTELAIDSMPRPSDSK